MNFLLLQFGVYYTFDVGPTFQISGLVFTVFLTTKTWFDVCYWQIINEYENE